MWFFPFPSLICQGTHQPQTPTLSIPPPPPPPTVHNHWPPPPHTPPTTQHLLPKNHQQGTFEGYERFIKENKDLRDTHGYRFGAIDGALLDPAGVEKVRC
jgi:hypothetical protein